MENLWAPWRIGFILGPKPEGCFLCDSPAAGRDAEHWILERGARCFAILNRYPYNNGHLMVAPFRHVGDFTALEPDEAAEVMTMAQAWVGALGRAMHPDGYNVGFNLGRAAGAGVADHVHLHVVPRWNGDTSFMSTVGDVRVVNQSLDECWRVLRRSGTGTDHP